MTRARIAAGRQAEELAARELMQSGMRVLERNVRVRYAEWGIAGELDIVALDGDALVYVTDGGLVRCDPTGTNRTS